MNKNSRKGDFWREKAQIVDMDHFLDTWQLSVRHKMGSFGEFAKNGKNTGIILTDIQQV